MSTTGRSSWLVLVSVFAFAGLLVPSESAVADVRFKTLADGTRMIYNEAPAHRSRRQSGTLLRVPQIDIGRMIDRHARQASLDPRLVQAVIQVESGYNARALSNKGAMGLMQLMPGTAKQLRVGNAYDPDENIRGGTTYLRRQLDRFNGDLTLALAAYNAGPGAVERYEGVPPYRETRNYVERVYRLYRGRSAPAASQAERTGTPRTEAPRVRGKKVFVTRDANDRIVFTTEAPRPR